MARRVRLSTWYVRTASKTLRRGSSRGQAVGRTIDGLSKADELPGPTDYEATQKPIGKAWVRRVGGRNLWVWYRFSDEEVILAAVSTEPPVPVDDE
jgi:hypothetical protein